MNQDVWAISVRRAVTVAAAVAALAAAWLLGTGCSESRVYTEARADADDHVNDDVRNDARVDANSHADKDVRVDANGHSLAAVRGDDYLRDVTVVTHPPLGEISGIERSDTYPDLWWVHNDSGNGPYLYAINAGGKVVMPGWRLDEFYVDTPEDGKEPWPGIQLLNSANQDWEDIVLHDGRLYIAELGNNGNAKRDLGFYIVNEPNPAAIDQGMRPITFITIAYPDQDAYPPVAQELSESSEITAPAEKQNVSPATIDWRFDCEAVFISDGKPYLLTKYRADCRFDKITTGTSLYRLDTMNPDGVNTLTLVSRADDLPIIPTSADLSPDGRRLAVLSNDDVFLFEKPGRGDDWLGGRMTRINLLPERIKQAEGVCWDDADTLRIVNEQRDIFTLDLRVLRALEPTP
jgi:hypothetical protein